MIQLFASDQRMCTGSIEEVSGGFRIWTRGRSSSGRGNVHRCMSAKHESLKAAIEEAMLIFPGDTIAQSLSLGFSTPLSRFVVE